jgi:ribosomal protein S18 acetylase RimI-like enzyme
VEALLVMVAKLKVRIMREADIPAAMYLKNKAGWNQSPEDWKGFMYLEPEGCFVGELDGEVVATATAINYAGRFGWIGMIIVDPIHRRQGIATRMMEQTISYLESCPCSCLKLDATDAGAKVYEKIGFKVEYLVERWLRETDVMPDKGVGADNIKMLEAEQLPGLLDYDQEVFGSSRRRLLEWYLRRESRAYMSSKDSAPTGFLCGRSGSKAFQIGPGAAADIEVARNLIGAMMKEIGNQPVIADVIASNTEVTDLLETYSFNRTRVLKRMYRGENRYPGLAKRVLCLAGFEFG